MAPAPRVKLNSGHSMPAIGLGTWLATNDCKDAIKGAIDAGYRHFDTALVYQNERVIGEAIREKIADGSVTREELFITSKLWNTYHRPDLVEKGLKKTLKNFGLDYIDLYLIHWPMAFKATDQADGESKEHKDLASIMGDPEFIPVDGSGAILHSDDDYLDTWKEMEKCVEKGLTKSIGVSNFNSQQLARLLAAAKIKPVTNQFEVHAYLNQKKLIAFCKQHDVVVTAFSPLGSQNPSPDPNIPKLIENPKICGLAQQMNKTPGQVLLRYLVQQGVVPIPKSTNPVRMRDNLSVFDFELSTSQVEEIESVNCNLRYCIMLGTEINAHFPFGVEF